MRANRMPMVTIQDRHLEHFRSPLRSNISSLDMGGISVSRTANDPPLFF